ncbi:thioesterase II family protein [Streptomyces sp. 4N509B]|uniref:thioesterase II family protein n=1 Tax=Streptomyces sp. 4N509B TaxID=3457413 RepID=UPI003FD65B4D
MTRAREASGTWIRRFHPSPTGAARLLCFPPAGESASFYFAASRELATRVEVLAVQYPGRQDRHEESCARSIPELAHETYLAVQPWTDKPLFVFGHRMGAAVGFELCRRLERRAPLLPRGLFASEGIAPSHLARSRDLLTLWDAPVPAPAAGPSPDRLTTVDEHAPAHWKQTLLRCDHRAMRSYRPSPVATVRCPIVALVGENGTGAAGAGEDGTGPEGIDVERWEHHTESDFDVQIRSGGPGIADTDWPEVTDLVEHHVRRLMLKRP